jgi:hypothetical protein
MNIYSRHLKQFGIYLPYEGTEGVYRFYSGDTSVSDKGEVLIWQPALAAKAD